MVCFPLRSLEAHCSQQHWDQLELCFRVQDERGRFYSWVLLCGLAFLQIIEEEMAKSEGVRVCVCTCVCGSGPLVTTGGATGAGLFSTKGVCAAGRSAAWCHEAPWGTDGRVS